MRVIAIIDDPNVTKKILCPLGLWSRRTAPPRKVSGPWTREPHQDDPMSDYEIVLTD